MPTEHYTAIIPEREEFYDRSLMERTEFAFDGSKTLDLESIAIFAAIGFFLDDATYYEEIRTMRPATTYTMQGNRIVDIQPRWQWHYTPEEKPFEQVVEEFTELFDGLVAEHTAGKRSILPLSGGLDSRSLAVAMRHDPQNVHAYSYEFENGRPESRFARGVAEAVGIEYEDLIIPEGYLWEVIDELSEMNHCFSDFTHPRQMAIFDRYAAMGDMFLLGHWGDVLFDNAHLDGADKEQMLAYLMKAVVKKGGTDLGELLWQQWSLPGDFKTTLRSKLEALLEGIEIEDPNARVRAFKSLYWAPRWTTSNLSVFAAAKPMYLPYYDDKMCEFIARVPETYLANRQIQIAYICNQHLDAAKVTWQDTAPYNLTNCENYLTLQDLPRRIWNKLDRVFKQKVLRSKPPVMRNWENQFVGTENEAALEAYLNDPGFLEWVGADTVASVYRKFQNEDRVYFSHPVSMLLTLSVFYRKHRAGSDV